ncbi:hypothetical protein Bca52824_025935 [Brassica carinata]|uniref:F-box domain-containing protein n=1 Tax=Brassica carinata TaxID=52824 RepID=A0A8X7SH48_BRACI|nr:hypothetical protein Bca52824_025935 [Brassica carinata]
MADDRKIEGALDLISSLPDEILQHILSFVSTKVAIRTSLLSRSWRHVWCEVPSLSLEVEKLTTAASINETLTRYTAPKTKSFQLVIKPMMMNIPYIDRWIKFAMSHSLENLSLEFPRPYYQEYKLPDFFYNSCSFKQLNITLSSYRTMVPKCTVSWTSLQKLSLSCYSLSDESMAKILSGCPVLENLTLSNCDELKLIDLSKSLRLKTLQVNCGMTATQIVAPHIHFLRLVNPQSSYTLVDVASLTEAELEISFFDSHIKTDFPQLQVKVLEMLYKLQNADKLTLGSNFIQIISLAEILGVPFPMLKIKSLTFDTKTCQYVIPGIERLLQNSPDLEKLTVRGRTRFHIPVEIPDMYLELQGLNVNKWSRAKNRASWAKHRKDAKLEHVASLVELMLKNTEKLDKMVLLLDGRYLNFKIEDLTATLSHHNNVTIVLSCTKKK